MIDIVELDDFSVVVGENWEVEIVVLGEGFVREWSVDAYSHNLCIDLVQLLHVVPQRAHFTGAHCGECSREEGEQCCTVRFQKLVKAARFSVSVWKREVRTFFALVDHSQPRWASALDVSKPYSPVSARLSLERARGSGGF